MTLTLFRTIVGAHIWKMEHKGSDIDLFECYQAPTVDILRGNADMKNYFEVKKEEGIDLAKHELLTVANQLLRGNVNFTFGVMSPLVQETSDVHKELVSLFKSHPPKNLYYSMRGMAVHNFRLFEKVGKLNNPKKINTIMRVLKCGTNYLNSGELHFKAYTGGVRSEVMPAIAELDAAYKASNLIESIPEDYIRNIILKARLEGLEGYGL